MFFLLKATRSRNGLRMYTARRITAGRAKARDGDRTTLGEASTGSAFPLRSSETARRTLVNWRGSKLLFRTRTAISSIRPQNSRGCAGVSNLRHCRGARRLKRAGRRCLRPDRLLLEGADVVHDLPAVLLREVFPRRHGATPLADLAEEDRVALGLDLR